MRFLDVRTDYAFKKVFGSEESKDILISFLNAVIDFESGAEIREPYYCGSLSDTADKRNERDLC